ncbi:protein YceG [Caenispirillum salinarum AK4]|uniref:Endolytic murein transglycosylase n=1 Tax=Caenispirillum salinarum AK4 TaxID=1238182 RepID=K9GW48_9PROT|nr:endolytic transglycosylase MltG [Caenispirillum salinarum]EKV30165.1 protein YceG [Caenispirillum salinarum AK4]
MKRVLLALVLLVILAGAGLAYGLYWFAGETFTARGPLEEPVIVEVPKGSGLARITENLADAGVIADRDVSKLIFKLKVRESGKAASLHAGEFQFEPGVSMAEVTEILASGKVVARFLTVAEGLTSPEVMALVSKAEALTGAVPDPPPPTGTLLPETYHYTRGDSRADVVARMEQSMDKALEDLWPTRAEDLPIDTPEEAVILASIVEKETALASERPRVAAVFVNRLRRGMRLQSDPTVIYGLDPEDGDLGRPLRKSELERETAYNTYVIGGLPPGPIANPGRESLAAVLNPAETDDLYFVADGTGGHAFAKTLREHNRNVANWRRIERQRAGE